MLRPCRLYKSILKWTTELILLQLYVSVYGSLLAAVGSDRDASAPLTWLACAFGMEDVWRSRCRSLLA